MRIHLAVGPSAIGRSRGGAWSTIARMSWREPADRPMFGLSEILDIGLVPMTTLLDGDGSCTEADAAVRLSELLGHHLPSDPMRRPQVHVDRSPPATETTYIATMAGECCVCVVSGTQAKHEPLSLGTRNGPPRPGASVRCRLVHPSPIVTAR